MTWTALFGFLISAQIKQTRRQPTWHNVCRPQWMVLCYVTGIKQWDHPLFDGFLYSQYYEYIYSLLFALTLCHCCLWNTLTLFKIIHYDILIVATTVKIHCAVCWGIIYNTCMKYVFILLCVGREAWMSRVFMCDVEMMVNVVFLGVGMCVLYVSACLCVSHVMRLPLSWPCMPFHLFQTLTNISLTDCGKTCQNRWLIFFLLVFLILSILPPIHLCLVSGRCAGARLCSRSVCVALRPVT